MSSTESSIDVFLSYNSRDRALAMDLRQILEAQGLKLFFDTRSLSVGMPWPQELEEALRAARAVAIVVGPHGLGSWQRRELYLALSLQVQAQQQGSSFPVIPVLLPGAQPIDGFLTLNTWIDLRDGFSPADSTLADRILRASEFGNQHRELETVCPYRGLRYFREEDSSLYFGRTASIEALVRKVNASSLRHSSASFVALIGPSGSGKSSLVQAGLIPQLGGNLPPQLIWDIALLTPGEDPWRRLADSLLLVAEAGCLESSPLVKAAELARSLAADTGELASFIRDMLRRSRGTDRVLVIIDQFEEIFTLTPQAQREPFIRSLFTAAKDAPMTLLISLRGDFYGRAIALDRELSDLLAREQVTLGPMTSQELIDCIVKPGILTGITFENGLIDEIVKDVRAEPGRLALLEYALTELWSSRQSRTLTLSNYVEIGRVEKAISQRAETIYAALTEEEQLSARALFTRLVKVAEAGGEGADTRRRSRRSELSSGAWDLVEIFANSGTRLLVTSQDPATGEEVVDLSHEVLLQSWPRLRQWIDEERSFLSWRQHLGVYYSQWVKTRSDSDLLTGRALAESESWHKIKKNYLSDDETSFIVNSILFRKKLKAARKLVLIILLLAVCAAAAWPLYTRSDHYQINLILDDGIEDRLFEAPGTARRNWPNLPAFLYLGKKDDLFAAATKTDHQSSIIGRSGVAVALFARGDTTQANELLGKLAEEVSCSPCLFENTSGMSNLITALKETGQRERAANLLNKLDKSVRPDLNPQHLITVKELLAFSWLSLGEHQKGLKAIQELETIARSSTSGPELAEILADCARWHYSVNNTGRSRALLRNVASIIRTSGRQVNKHATGAYAAQLFLNGLHTEALDLFDLIADQGDRNYELTRLVSDLSRRKMLNEAKIVVARIDSDFYKDRALGHIAREMITEGMEHDWHLLLQSSSARSERVGILMVSYIQASAELGQLQKAQAMQVRLQSAYNGSRDIIAKGLIALAKGATKKSEDEAAAYLQKTEAMIDYLPPFGAKNEIRRSVSEVWAQLGNYRNARLLASEITDDSRLDAYIDIVVTYAKRRNPSLPSLSQLELPPINLD